MLKIEFLLVFKNFDYEIFENALNDEELSSI